VSVTCCVSLGLCVSVSNMYVCVFECCVKTDSTIMSGYIAFSRSAQQQGHSADVDLLKKIYILKKKKKKKFEEKKKKKLQLNVVGINVNPV